MISRFENTYATATPAGYLVCFAALCPTFAQAQGNSSFASDNNRFDGDHLTLRTILTGFTNASVPDDKSTYCAPAGAKFVVTRDTETKLSVRFLNVEADPKDAANKCPTSAVVQQYVTYEIGKDRLAIHDFKRTGVAFGGLVVPFKFRLGDKEIVSSSTVAPFIGWRTSWLQKWGLTFTPIASAGLGLVPITDPQTSSTETKAAISLATGLVLGSSKNDTFQAGLLIGKDFLGKADRQRDPSSKKGWVSFYIGYNLSQN